MQALLSDLRILKYSAMAFRILYLLKAVLTVAIIVFSALETAKFLKASGTLYKANAKSG